MFNYIDSIPESVQEYCDSWFDNSSDEGDIKRRPIDQFFYDMLNDEAIDLERNPEEFAAFLAEYGLTPEDLIAEPTVTSDVICEVELPF